jgi:hypothetical protein
VEQRSCGRAEGRAGAAPVGNAHLVAGHRVADAYPDVGDAVSVIAPGLSAVVFETGAQRETRREEELITH